LAPYSPADSQKSRQQTTRFYASSFTHTALNEMLIALHIEVFEEDGRIILQPLMRERIQRVRGMFKGAGALDVLIAERKLERERENGKASPRLR
jgi:hypothetical protein